MSTDTTIEREYDPDPDVRDCIDAELTDKQADYVAALIWQYHDKRGYTLDHLRTDLAEYGDVLSEADIEAIIASDYVDEREEHRHRVDIPYYGDVAAEIAKFESEVRDPGDLITHLTAHRERDGEFTASFHDHHELLDHVGDLLVEHRPDEVPDRDDFIVRLVDITVGGDSFVVIEET